MTSAPGFWPSPITAEQAVTSGRSLEAVAFAGDQLWWSEGRPGEGGRVVVAKAHRPLRFPRFPWLAKRINDHVSIYVPKILGLLVEAVLEMTLASVKASM